MYSLCTERNVAYTTSLQMYEWPAGRPDALQCASMRAANRNAGSKHAKSSSSRLERQWKHLPRQIRSHCLLFQSDLCVCAHQCFQIWSLPRDHFVFPFIKVAIDSRSPAYFSVNIISIFLPSSILVPLLQLELRLEYARLSCICLCTCLFL